MTEKSFQREELRTGNINFLEREFFEESKDEYGFKSDENFFGSIFK